MDISGLSSIYSDYADMLKTQNNASANKLSSLSNQDLSGKSEDELLEVCQEFEAYFMEMMMKEMVKTVGTEEESSNSMVDYFKDTAITDLAKKATEQESMGLAQQLYEQMKRNYSIE